MHWRTPKNSTEKYTQAHNRNADKSKNQQEWIQIHSLKMHKVCKQAWKQHVTNLSTLIISNWSRIVRVAILSMSLLILSRVNNHRYKYQTERHSPTKREKSLKICYSAKGNIKLSNRLVTDLTLLKEVSRWNFSYYWRRDLNRQMIILN